MNDLTNAALQLAALALTIFGSYALTKLSAWLGVKQDSEVRGYLQDALGIAVSAGQRRLMLAMAGAPPEQVATLHAQVIGEAATYVASKVPGALKHFGISDVGLRDMIEKRLEPLIHALPAPAAS